MVEKRARKTILVVDDEPQNIRILREILKGEYRVVAATDGAMALSLAESQLPDLIMLDIVMPDLDGFEVLRRLRSRTRTAAVPVVFVTSKGEISEKMDGYESGASDYVTKPLDPAFVTSVVHRLLAGRPNGGA